MNWGRAVGAAACLAAVVMSGSACANTVEGTPHAQGSATPASGAPSPKAAQSVGGVPACADIGSAVTAVVSGYSLDPKLSLPAAGGSTMCFFMKGGRAGADDFAVSLSASDKSADELSRVQEYLAKSKPEQLVESAAATRLGGYVSDPLGTGDLALAMPGALVSVHVGSGEQLTRRQLVDVLVAVGEVIAG